MPVQHVYIDSSVHPIYKQLTAEGYPFVSMKDVFLTAAVLGYHNGTRKSLQRRQDVFQYATFSTQTDLPTLQAIAILETGSVEVIANVDEVLGICQEFANGGIGHLLSIIEAPGNPIDNCFQYLLAYGQKES